VTEIPSQIIERIRALHLNLIERAEYSQYVTAKTDKAAVEGDMDADTYMASVMIRDAARAAGDNIVAAQKLAVLTEVVDGILNRIPNLAKLKRQRAEYLESVRLRLAMNGKPEEWAEGIIARERN
jgi:hypothetical protein